MKWSWLYFLLVFIACHASRANTDKADWYKVMAGKVGDHPITMHLHHYDSSYSGYYYYNARQQPISFFGTVDTAGNNSLTLTANMGAARYETFSLQWHQTAATGKWKQENARKLLPVTLSQIHPSLPFSYLHTGQTIPLKELVSGSPEASFDAASVWPAGSGETEAWVKTEIRHMLYDSVFTGDIEALLLRQQQQFFEAYRTANSTATEAEINEFPGAYNASELTNLQVAFLSDNILCLAQTNYSYTGGAHGNYGTRFLVLDLQQKKVLAIRDVVTNEGLETVKPLLEKSFREQYDVPPTQKLTDAGLFDESIAPNSNFYVTGKGIGFVYNPYEIGPYAMGEINLFVPYSLMQPALQPAFKALLP